VSHGPSSGRSHGATAPETFLSLVTCTIIDFTREDVVDRVLELTGGEGVDTAIEALGADITFQAAVKITKPGGTVSSTGYFGEGEYVHIPRVEWGVGMADKTIATGPCPGGRLRMERLLRVLQGQRVNPAAMTTHRFRFDEIDQAFEVMDKKLDDVIKPLITA
jgi:isopropanol dehydrogenase (NADP+)